MRTEQKNQAASLGLIAKGINNATLAILAERGIQMLEIATNATIERTMSDHLDVMDIIKLTDYPNHE